MLKKTWSATDVANDLGESRDLVVRICMDCAVFLTGYVVWEGNDPRLDEDAIEEVKETISKLRKEPTGIEEYMMSAEMRFEL
ncbi:hypothetical protein SLH49_19960 [Cognatiyoonia sp. IB215446]|uniref:hypothetical protein n=1 Tax=Cognatiyoonia sp. IB215446 TaxID=3097355 RepID=UPI002A1858B3|nr:hypothetical protein [Cognatiyoonia sp. IB215446]MDX8350273.1 hypothetical protein [Cognatiyoonia sp. IB215446]